tara:strand:+ start:286 stop:1575 length:1290 start_codon:yes stop_codon:yes gene_type:complete
MFRYISPAFLTFSILLLIYVFFRSEIVWDGSIRYYYKIYYFLSFFLIIFSIISFFISIRIKKYIFYSFIFISFLAYTFEGYFAYKYLFKINIKEKISRYKKETNLNYDTRTKFETYNDLKNKYKNITIRYLPVANLEKENLDIYSLSGRSYSKTIFCVENGYRPFYDSDRYGFNNNDIFWDKDIEIVFVGSGYAQGACVKPEANLVSKFIENYGEEAISLGMRGNGPLTILATLKEYLPKETKKIIWLFNEADDHSLLELELQHEILSQYLDNSFSQGLIKKQKLIDTVSKTVNQFENTPIRKFNVKEFLKLRMLRSLMNPERTLIHQESYFKIIKETKEFLKEKNIKLYFVYLPEYLRYKSIFYNNGNYETIKEITKQLNIQLIDMHNLVFKDHPRPLSLFPFEQIGHYNEEGHKIVATIISNYLKSN